MKKPIIKIKATKQADGITLDVSLEGCTPNEFREAMFNVIAQFTNKFNEE
jgi:hypothetical protein